MASVKNKDIPDEFKFTGEYFEFRKKYYTPEIREEYWTECFAELENLSKKYNSSYLDGLLLQCVSDFERRFRQANIDKEDAITFIPEPVLDHVYKMLVRRRERANEGM